MISSVENQKGSANSPLRSCSIGRTLAAMLFVTPFDRMCFDYFKAAERNGIA